MKLIITSTLLFLAFSPLTQAKHSQSLHNNKHSNTVSNHSALKVKVKNAYPAYKYVKVSHPKKYYGANAVYKAPKIVYRQPSDKSGIIIGGTLGGVIGHTVSDKNHKGLGTIIGAVIGSTLVHNIKHVNRKPANSYKVRH